MKRFLLILVVSMLAIAVSAQKVNPRGEKMVAQLDIEKYYFYRIDEPVTGILRTTYKFGYDDSRLVSVDGSMRMEWLNKEKDRFSDGHQTKYKIHGDSMTRDEYEGGKLCTTGEWKYLIEGDIVTKAQYYDYALDGSGGCLRYDYNFYYTSTDKGYPRMCRSIQNSYYREAGTKHFVMCDLFERSLALVYRYRDGNPDIIQLVTPCSAVDLDDFDERNFQYTDMINDTNINWMAFTAQFVQWESFDSVLPMTEWVPCKPEHLPLGYMAGHIIYSYVFDRGNLVRVDITYGGRLKKMIKVTYVE